MVGGKVVIESHNAINLDPLRTQVINYENGHTPITKLSGRDATCGGIVLMRNPEVGVEAVQDRESNKGI